MFDSLPDDVSQILDWNWSKFAPYAKNLREREVSADSTELWMGDFTKLMKVISEMGQRVYVATTVDTTDEEANQLYQAYFDNIFPEARKLSTDLGKKLVDSGIVPEGMEIPLRNIKGEIELFREKNLPLFSQESKLGTEYDRLIGAQTVEWDGEEITLSQLRPVFFETDRERREMAWRLSWERRLQDRPVLNDTWTRFMNIREQIAKNADLPDYRAFKWKELNRFDYTPDDALAFFDAIEKVVVPAAERIREKRRQLLGLDSLRPWDLDVDPDGRDPLKPFDDVQVLEDKSVEIFNKIDPELGEFVRIMRDEGYLDLKNRKGKAPGGYCTYYAKVNRPFIFMNSVGLHDDVQTMFHESGHAFHAFFSGEMPYYQQQDAPMEFCEVASMAMELLASPYLTTEMGGFYSTADAARALTEHLEGIILFWPYMAVVSAFQHWIYTNHSVATDAAKCDDKWEELWDRFMKGIDYTGLEKYKRMWWQRQLHIYQVPFYYIEYGLAQLGAVQVWANSLKDHAKALADYRQALKLGYTVPLPELFQTAGVKLAFDAETLSEAVNLAEKTIAELEAVQ